MNYLKRQTELIGSMATVLKGRPAIERDAEFDRALALLIALSDAYYGVISDAVTRTLYGTDRSDDVRNSGETDVDRIGQAIRCMEAINGLCRRYGVSDMFPQAGSGIGYQEAEEILAEYHEELSAKRRLHYIDYQG